MASRLAAINAHFGSLLAAAEARLIAHVQGRIAQIDPGLSPAARMAAIERLNSEQVGALARLRQDIGQERKQALRAARAAPAKNRRTRKRAQVSLQMADRARLTRIVGPKIDARRHEIKSGQPYEASQLICSTANDSDRRSRRQHGWSDLPTKKCLGSLI